MTRPLMALALAIPLLVAGVWLGRDPLLKTVGNQYATLATGLVTQIETVKTKPSAGLNRYAVTVTGTIAGAPFHFTGTVNLLPLKITEHTLKVSRFPLTAINRRISGDLGFEFTRGTVDVHSSGQATLLELAVAVRLMLRRFAVRTVSPESFPTQEMFLNMLAGKSELPLILRIRGSPFDPEIVWPQQMQLNLIERGLKSLKDLSHSWEQSFR